VFLAGFSSAIAFPTWQAFLADIVPKDHVAGALSLMFAQWNIGRILGPALAAIVVSGGHYAWALYINTFSFLVVIITLLLIRDKHYQEHHRRLMETNGDEREKSLWAGWRFIFSRESGLFKPFLSYALIIFWASPFIALIPNVADIVFHKRSLGTSLFTTFQGIGAVTIAVLLTTMHKKYGPARTQQIFFIILPFVLIGFGSAPNLIFATPIALLFGFNYIGTLTSTTLASQLAAPPQLKGRVSAAFVVPLGLIFPIASQIQATFVHHVGARPTFITSGIALAICLIAIGAFNPSYNLPEPFEDSQEQPAVTPEEII
jgi:MFS family permease